MIETIAGFIQYFKSVRRRTLNYLRVIPPDQLDWSPREGEFTCGDILRHIIATEKMFIGVVVDGHWKYEGHENKGQQGLEESLALLEAGHVEAMSRLEKLSDEALGELRPSLNGPSVKVWRWLMAMAEHEIHHRSQLAVYLSLMGVQPPHIFGLGVEDIIALTVG
ncbi:MAG: DinB family protein [Chloroflexi bacterium]|nr:DinB family protein [Chloroflexota bacterium]